MNTQEINKASNKPNIQTIIQSMEQNNPELYNDIFMAMFNGIGRRETGLYYTPDNIADLISSIGQVYNPQSVIDICCGIGNIINSFQNVQATKGIDINPNNIRLAKYINSAIDFIVADTTTYDFGNEKYDLVIGNLPWGARTADRKSLEIELIKKGLTLLNDNGIAIFVVPEGLLTSSVSFEFRQEILSNFALDMVVSLPIGIFPYSGIKTSILVLRNGEKNQDVFIPEFQDNSLEIVENFKQHKGDFYLPISKITDRLDRNYYLLLDSIEKKLGSYQRIKLADVSKIIRGKYLKDFKSSGNYLVFNRQDKKGNNFVDFIANDNYILQPDDIVVCLKGINNKIYFYKQDGIKTVITDNYAIIRPVENNKYITTYLKTEDGLNVLQQQLNRNLKGSAIQFISLSALSNIEIPLLPLAELNELISKNVEINENKFNFLQEFSAYIKNKQYNYARICIRNSEAFKNANHEENQSLESLANIVEDAEKKDKELEDMMSMFAHKFRSPLDAIIYNSTHQKNTKLYIESAQTMHGLLNIFSIISADDKILLDKLKKDNKGNSNLIVILTKTLDMMLLHLLSVSGISKIHQHYMNYAKIHGKIDASISYKEWCDDYFDIEGQLQKQWEQEFSALIAQPVSLQQRLHWIEQYFFKLNIIGFENNPIQFKEYETTESLLFILINEILVNAFKYYASETKQAVILEWTPQNDYQVLTCRNPSIRREREQFKGSGKGHSFLSALARKTNSQFNKPKPQDDFILNFSLPNEILF